MSFLSGILGGKEEPIPTMDKRIVEKSLKDRLWPLLEVRGFQTFRGTTAWRHAEKKIDVVHIEFFNKGLHDKWGTTPYSFALATGCFSPFIPPITQPSIQQDKNGLLLPKETACHLRKTPSRKLRQGDCKIPNVWYVDPEGEYLAPAVTDAKEVLEGEVLSWFKRFDDSYELLRTLLEDPEDMSTSNNCWGFGRKNSPVRFFLIGFAALELQKWQMARDTLQQALITGRFAALTGTEAIEDEIRRGIAKAETALRGVV